MDSFSDPLPEPQRDCDHPDCGEDGLYRAPKSRDNLRDYHWFCLEHVRTYNKAWNYCAGMSEDEIEVEIRRSTTWERPTWRAGAAATLEDRLRQTVYEGGGFYGYGTDAPVQPKRKATPETKALEVLGLPDPCAFTTVKTRYRELVKLHHPDTNGGDPAAEERIKTINQAFNTLKRARDPDKVY